MTDKSFCVWQKDTYDETWVRNFHWVTDCGKVFEFRNEGSNNYPTKQGAKFCMFCGKPLKQISKEKAYEDNEDD